MNNGDYDFIIIGSGAGGGTLAYRLAPSGKKILLIERGPYVRREKDNWNSRAVNAEGKYNTKELWRSSFPPARTRFWRDQTLRRHFTSLADFVRRTRAILH